MKQQLFKKSGISALAVAAVLAFWPAPSQAQAQEPGQGQGQGQGQERRGGGEGRGGEGRSGGGGGQRGPAPQASPQAAPQAAPQARPAAQEQRAPQQERVAPQERTQERAVEQQRQIAPARREGVQRQQTYTQSPQRYERRQEMDSGSRRVYRDGGYDRYRSRDRYASGFVFLGGPRVVVRGYGSGWCRGLHRGRHSAPGIGRHGGTHRGLFRC
jgi:hypothetical protein